MQVQSSTDPPKKLALGERAVMVDGNEYNALQLKEGGQPIEIVYPTEGTPMAVGPNAIFKNAPNPNAARLLNSYMFTPECQQLVIDVGALRSVHPNVKEHAGRKPFKDIKVMKDDAAGVEKNAAISGRATARYSGFEMETKFNRRDVLKAGTALTASPCLPSHSRRSATGRGGDARADRGREERGQGRPLHLGRSAAGGKGRQGVRGEIPRNHVRIERTGAERVFQRIAQERGSNIHACDVVQSSDAAHFVVWKREGILAPTSPKRSRSTIRGTQGRRRVVRELSRLSLRDGAQHRSGEGEDGPKGYRDLLDPKWAARSSRRIPATAAPS